MNQTTPTTDATPARTIPADVLKVLTSCDPYAVSQLADFGPGYFNPLIGHDPAETCGNISEVVGLLHGLMDTDITEIRQGVALIMSTVWSAAQYEGYRTPADSSSVTGAGDAA